MFKQQKPNLLFLAFKEASLEAALKEAVWDTPADHSYAVDGDLDDKNSLIDRGLICGHFLLLTDSMHTNQLVYMAKVTIYFYEGVNLIG
jgi:hypothetical protein